MGFYWILLWFNGVLWDQMGFYGILWWFKGFFWDLMGFNGIYPLVNIQKATENHHLQVR
jgi:hypothetical protein